MGDSSCVNARLVDLGPVAVIYADGIASAVSNGETVRIVFFEYRLLDGDRVRVPVVEMIRPLSSIKAGMVTALILESKLAQCGVRLMH